MHHNACTHAILLKVVAGITKSSSSQNAPEPITMSDGESLICMLRATGELYIYPN